METSIPKEHVVKIGSKGEIPLPKEIIDYLGLQKEQDVILSVVSDILMIRKVFSYEEILKKPAKVKLKKDAWKKFKEDINQEILQ